MSAVLGVAAGVALALMISSRRAGVLAESTVLALLGAVVISYFSLDAAGGSGYLGAFLTGLIVGTMDHLGLGMHPEHERDMRRFATHASDLVTPLVFVMLGANIPLGQLRDNLLPALVIVAVLLLVARPVTVLACTLPDRRGRWTWQEIVSMGWTRETGVVPAALVGVLAGTGVPDGGVFASVVALAIVLTLLVQALPAAWLARRLGLHDDQLA